MLNLQRLHAAEHRIKLIDEEIVELAAEGYMVDVDRMLDERRRQQQRRDALFRVDLPDG
jgi:hypothetical protein